MQILVDADACPVIETVEKIAKEYCIPVTLLCDTNHDLTSDYSEILQKSHMKQGLRAKAIIIRDFGK